MSSQVLIVSNDAGGAEVLSAWCAENKSMCHLNYCLSGPAEEIFRRDLGDLKVINLDKMNTLPGLDFVLTGSSLESDLERKAIAMCRERKVRSVTFLDHWDLYRERFDSSHGLEAGLPDEIWVGDEYGLIHAKTCGFPEDRLKLVPNPYFQKIRKLSEASVVQKPIDNYRTILFICEPISRKLAATFGIDSGLYDDEIATVRKFLASASDAYSRGLRCRIILRLHPSEIQDKYSEVIQYYSKDMKIDISKEKALVKDILESDVVVGIESMGLVIAALCGKPVYSGITGKFWEISLPQQEINCIRSFADIFSNAV